MSKLEKDIARVLRRLKEKGISEEEAIAQLVDITVSFAKEY